MSQEQQREFIIAQQQRLGIAPLGESEELSVPIYKPNLNKSQTEAVKSTNDQESGSFGDTSYKSVPTGNQQSGFGLG